MLCVLVFHAGLPIQSGGVAGVTLFFVLSGYLIATLLMREGRTTGTIDLRRFLARRAWRLIPALVAVMVLLLILRMPADDTHELAEDSVLTLVYLANWARSGGDDMGWWNHGWSLSVEGQFYLVAALVIMLFGRARAFGYRRFIPAIAIAVMGAVVWRWALMEGGASSARIYFGTDTRMDALLLGCLLAAVHMGHPSWKPSPALGPIALVSFGLLVGLPMVEALGPGTAYTLIALASLGVVTASLGDDQRWTALDAPLLVWVGERSYSLYLVHVPVFMYLNDVLAGVAPAARVGTAVLLSLVLSAILFRYVERPLRYGITHRRREAGASSATRDESAGTLRLGPTLPA